MIKMWAVHGDDGGGGNCGDGCASCDVLFRWNDRMKV